MAGKSYYLQNKFLDWLLRGQSYTPPTTVYVGLYTTAPTDAGGGVEVSGGSYARSPVSSALASWAATQGGTTVSTGSSGMTSNLSAIPFNVPTANWGTVVAVGLFDQASGGNLLYWSTLTGSKVINSGDGAPQFQAGALTITED